MTVGQLRNMLATLPDDWQVFSFNEQNPAGDLITCKSADVVESDEAVYIPVTESAMEEKPELLQREDLHRLFLRAGIIRTGFVNWRFVKREPGEINALERLRGVIVATDGIDCLVEREDGSYFEGHLEWFIPDRVAYPAQASGNANRKWKKKQSLPAFVEPSLNIDEL